MNSRSPLILTDENGNELESNKDILDKELLKESEKELEKDIPNGYIPIHLPSNGRIKGVPDTLYFRDFTGQDCLDINCLDERDKPKQIGKVLTRMCYEDFDVLDLPLQDIMFILRTIQATFINDIIEKEVYINEDLPYGDEEGELNHKSNLEKVEIKISNLKVALLGKDFDDNDINTNFKVPFTLTDTLNEDKVKLRLATLRDAILADNYCRKYFREDLNKFADIRKGISNLQKIRKEKDRNEKLDNYYYENEERIKEFQTFQSEYAYMVSKVIQSNLIVSYNDNELETLEEKWEVYTNKISNIMWNEYTKVLEMFPYGISDEVEYFSNEKNEVVTRRIPFQLADFILFNRRKENGRVSLSFD